MSAQVRTAVPGCVASAAVCAQVGAAVQLLAVGLGCCRKAGRQWCRTEEEQESRKAGKQGSMEWGKQGGRAAGGQEGRRAR